MWYPLISKITGSRKMQQKAALFHIVFYRRIFYCILYILYAIGLVILIGTLWGSLGWDTVTSPRTLWASWLGGDFVPKLPGPSPLNIPPTYSTLLKGNMEVNKLGRENNLFPSSGNCWGPLLTVLRGTFKTNQLGCNPVHNNQDEILVEFSGSHLWRTNGYTGMNPH